MLERLGHVVRWIGDGLAIILCVGAQALAFLTFPDPAAWVVLVAGIVAATLISLLGRALAYILVGSNPRGTFRPQRGELSEVEFNKLTTRIIRTATDGTIAIDAITATAKALGVLISFETRRQGCSKEELLNFSLQAVANFSSAADDLMDANPSADPRVKSFSL
jgi:hypothetical protein